MQEWFMQTRSVSAHVRLLAILASSGLAISTMAQPAGDSEREKEAPHDWEEIRAAHGADLEARGWDQRYVFDTFDHDHDGMLDQEEHRMLVVSLAVKDPDESATAMGSDSQAADSHISQAAENVVTNPQEETNPTLARGGPLTNGEERAAGAEPTRDQSDAVYEVAIEDLQGKTVTNINREAVGEVEQVVVNPRTDTLGLVVRSDAPGADDPATVVPLERVELTRDQELVWQTDRTAAEIQQMAEYRAEDYIPVSADDFPTPDAARDELLSTARKR
jgi:sporulation protein YlmC with PRC-barrel domain